MREGARPSPAMTASCAWWSAGLGLGSSLRRRASTWERQGGPLFVPASCESADRCRPRHLLLLSQVQQRRSSATEGSRPGVALSNTRANIVPPGAWAEKGGRSNKETPTMPGVRESHAATRRRHLKKYWTRLTPEQRRAHRTCLALSRSRCSAAPQRSAAAALARPRARGRRCASPTLTHGSRCSRASSASSDEPHPAGATSKHRGRR